MTSIRKPRTAVNLSMLSPGLGHVYCGVITRGLALQVCGLFALIVAILGLLAASPLRIILFSGGMAAALALAIYATVDARRLALQTREDYQLKDYNRPIVYALLAGLTALVAPLVAIVLRGWVLSAFIIPVNSNFPSLHPNDRILVDKQAYRSSYPAPGDQIVFANIDDRTKHWVKRVIALPGDTVEIRDGAVIVNGQPLTTRVLDDDVSAPGDEGKGKIVEESNGSAQYKTFHGDIPPADSSLRNAPPVTVPMHHVYVLGDHRDKSRDSRQFGPISIFSIEGKVTLRYWPLSPFSSRWLATTP